jgi:hypothetical protein
MASPSVTGEPLPQPETMSRPYERPATILRDPKYTSFLKLGESFKTAGLAENSCPSGVRPMFIAPSGCSARHTGHRGDGNAKASSTCILLPRAASSNNNGTHFSPLPTGQVCLKRREHPASSLPHAYDSPMKAELHEHPPTERAP